MGTHPIFESDFDCLTDPSTMASDARDILGDAAVSSLPKPTEKKSKSKRHRPAGMSYELFGLLNAGPSDPHPLVPTNCSNGYKAKARLLCNKARTWKWEAFENKGRTDDLKLFHWVSENNQNPTQTQFADFNRNIPFPTYTEDDLNKHKSDDWTTEETDYMMDLCKKFDCRFVLVQDRYDDNIHGKDRSVEEIKDRYYKITAPTNQSKNDTKVPYV